MKIEDLMAVEQKNLDDAKKNGSSVLECMYQYGLGCLEQARLVVKMSEIEKQREVLDNELRNKKTERIEEETEKEKEVIKLRPKHSDKERLTEYIDKIEFTDIQDIRTDEGTEVWNEINHIMYKAIEESRKLIGEL